MLNNCLYWLGQIINPNRTAQFNLGLRPTPNDISLPRARVGNNTSFRGLLLVPPSLETPPFVASIWWPEQSL